MGSKLIEQAGADIDIAVNGIEPTVSTTPHDVPFSAGAAPFHQAVIWLMEVGLGGGLTSSRYPMEEVMELVMIARDLGSAMTLGFVGQAAGAENAEKMVNEVRLPTVSKELHEICKGSQECNIQEMRRLVKEEKTKFGGSDRIEVFPLATYPSHVVVTNENHDVYRADLDRNTVTGRPYFTKITKLGVRPVSDWLAEGMDDLGSSVDLMMEGKNSDAKKKMVEFINRFGAIGGREGLLRAKYKVITRQLEHENFWKKYIDENRAMVQKYLHGELIKLREPNIRPHYAEAYTGIVPADKLQALKEKLITELRELGQKADQTLNRISQAVKDSQPVLQHNSFRNVETAVMVPRFRQFSEDFVLDLQGLRGAVQEALRDGHVPAMGMVYDAAAARFDEYKIAGRLIEKMLENFKAQASKA